MNQKEYKLIAGAIGRTNIVNNMDHNQIRRRAKNDALRLLTIDLAATLKHNYPKTFDHEKFMQACGI